MGSAVEGSPAQADGGSGFDVGGNRRSHCSFHKLGLRLLPRERAGGNLKPHPIAGFLGLVCV